jgi:hypothetical protein
VGGVRKEGGGRPARPPGCRRGGRALRVTRRPSTLVQAQGRVPCLKIGRFWRVRREALEYFPKKPRRGLTPLGEIPRPPIVEPRPVDWPKWETRAVASQGSFHVNEHRS